MTHSIKLFIIRLIPVIFYLGICVLAYHPINAVIQTTYIVILIAMGLDGGEISAKTPYQRRYAKSLWISKMGTWHAYPAQALSWIVAVANIYFWWIAIPDLMPEPIPQIKIFIVVFIVTFTPFLMPMQTMALGRVFRAFAEYKTHAGSLRDSHHKVNHV